MEWSGSTHVRPVNPDQRIAGITDSSLCLRWRYAPINQPNQVACQRWCCRIPTGLVPGPSECLDLYQPWIRRDPREYEPPCCVAFPDNWPDQQPLPGYRVSAAGPSAGQYQCQPW